MWDDVLLKDDAVYTNNMDRGLMALCCPGREIFANDKPMASGKRGLTVPCHVWVKQFEKRFRSKMVDFLLE